MVRIDMSKYGYVKELSEQRRLPLLGKIKLGLKVINPKGVEYPKETEYFVCPDEVKKIYGPEPKELDIMLPVAVRHVIFPTSYRWYGKTRGIKCLGNGETACRWSDDKKTMEEIECPCEKNKETSDGKRPVCNQRAFLMVILPQVNMGGVYQISTSSYNSIVDINSGLDYVEALIGRVQMVPLKFKREKVETHHDGNKQTHYTLKINFEGNINFINQLRENTKRILLEAEKIALPLPKDENPEFDEADMLESSGVKDEETESKGTQNTPETPVNASKTNETSESDDKIAEEVFGSEFGSDTILKKNLRSEIGKIAFKCKVTTQALQKTIENITDGKKSKSEECSIEELKKLLVWVSKFIDKKKSRENRREK